MTILTQSNAVSPEGLSTPVACEQQEAFNWREWHLKNRDAHLVAAKLWRRIAAGCQKEGDFMGVCMAQKYALRSENLAKDAEQKAAGF